MAKGESFIYELGVVGLGYVGLPLAVESANQNLSVLGFDIDESRVQQINTGNSPIEDVSDEELASALKNFIASFDSSKLADCKNIVISVPTPLTDY